MFCVSVVSNDHCSSKSSNSDQMMEDNMHCLLDLIICIISLVNLVLKQHAHANGAIRRSINSKWLPLLNTVLQRKTLWLIY